MIECSLRRERMNTLTNGKQHIFPKECTNKIYVDLIELRIDRKITSSRKQKTRRSVESEARFLSTKAQGFQYNSHL